MNRALAPLLVACCWCLPAQAQQWVELMNDPTVDLHDVQDAFQQYWDGRVYEKGKGWKQFKRWEWFMEDRVAPDGSRPDPMATYHALQQVKKMPQVLTKAASWTPLGPTSWTSSSYNPGNGRVNIVAEDPTNTNIIYVGTPGGGLWKSSNNGASWITLFDGMPTLGISGIAIDPTAPNTVYAATGDGDGGDTYSIGVVKSTDGGLSWNLTGLNWNTTQTRRTYDLLMHPTDPNTLFCAASNGLWRTEDGGANWTQVISGQIRDVEFKPGDPSIVLASSDTYFRSSDGGDTFTNITAGLPASTDVNRMAIGVSAADPTYVYILCGDENNSSYKGLYRSTDSGQTFSQRSNSPNIFGYAENGSDNGGQSWYDMAIAVDPNNANTVYSGGVNVWKSTNGGSSWTIVSHWVYPSQIGYTHADIHSLKFFGTRLYCGSDGGIFRSTNGGSNWTDLSAGLNIMQFYRMGGSEGDPDMVIAGAQDNGTNLLDGTWTHVIGADGMEATIDPNNPLVQFGTSQNGTIYRSYNGGIDFSNVTSSINENGGWVTPFVLDPDDSSILYAGYENVWKSDDLGDTWSPISNFSTSATVRVLAVAPSDPDHIYYGNANWLRHTSNGGGSWTNITGNLPTQNPTYISVHPDDPETAYLSLSGFVDGEKVFMTPDAGNTWVNISGNLPNVPVNCIVPQANTNGGVYVSTDVGVFYTDSTLSSWQVFSQGLPNVVVTELEINYANNELRAATYGRGLWETPLYTPSTAPPAVEFTWSSTSICAGDSITFTDLTQDAAPGWNWSFTGGSPATSTDPSPTVLFPGSGNYQVTLTMSNGNGPASSTQTVLVTVEPNMVDVTITVDDYPNETTWEITDGSNMIVASGGPFDGATSGDTFINTVCLPHGCYSFTILDSYGDGICCGFGNGSYEVYTPQLGIFASGGEFDFEETTDFCVSGTVDIGDGNASGMITVRYGELPGTYLIPWAGSAMVLSIAIWDASGRMVRPNDLELASGMIKLDLRDAASGIYTLMLSTGAKRYTTRLAR